MNLLRKIATTRTRRSTERIRPTPRSDQERLYVASQIVSSVAACLSDFAVAAGVFELFDLLELVGRLDLAVDAIRLANGASD